MKFLASAKSKVLAGVAADGTVSGTPDIGPFMGIAGAIIGVLAVVFAVKKGFSLLR